METVFENIVDFLERNPTEVIVIILEISVGDPTPADLWTFIQDIEGVQEIVYQHDASDTFPTMGKLVNSGEQLILFQHEGPKCMETAENEMTAAFSTTNEDCHERIMDFFHWTVETEFDFNNVKEIENIHSSCIGTRGWNMTIGGFYAVNNFVSPFYGPSKSSSIKLNDREFLFDRIADCTVVGEKEPNFVNIDYWQEGDLVEVTHEVNRARAVNGEVKKSLRTYGGTSGYKVNKGRGIYLGY